MRGMFAMFGSEKATEATNDVDDRLGDQRRGALVVQRLVRIALHAALTAGFERLAEQAFGSLLGSFGSEGDIDRIRPVDLNLPIDGLHFAWIIIDV